MTGVHRLPLAHIVLSLLSTVFMSACGFVDSGGSQDEPQGNAGPDRTVNEQALVPLNASATDVESFSWQQELGAGDPQVVLTGENTASAEFTAPNVTQREELVFTLTTVDEFGAVGTERVVVSVNNGPIADAGADRSARAGTQPKLNGDQSSDNDGTRTLSYMWRQISGTEVMLQMAASAEPTVVLRPGQPNEVLGFRLTVTDDRGARDTDEVTVRAINLPPVAKAVAPPSVPEGRDLLLRGNASNDPEGRPLDFQWEQIFGPAVALNGANTAEARFTAPDVIVPRIVTFRLTVTDNVGQTAFDIVRSTVLPGALDPPPITTVVPGAPETPPATPVIPGAPEPSPATPVIPDAPEPPPATPVIPDAPNTPPIGNAGLDQTVTELGSVTLDGSASRDPDGGAVAFQWRGSVTLTDAATARPSFVAPDVTEATALSFGLIVTDAEGASDSDSVIIRISPGAPGNTPPTANPDSGATDLNTPVIINVVANDTDDGSVEPTTVAITAPPVSGLAVSNGDGAVTYVPNAGFSGSDGFQYTVQDNEGATSTPATVTLQVGLVAPAAASCWTTASGRTLTARLPAKPRGFKDPVHYSFVRDGKAGTAAVLDPRTGGFQYTPEGIQARGADTLSYKVTDAQGRTRIRKATVIIDPRVMPLGDSVTAGVTDATRQLPVPEKRVGYRKPLQDKLVAAGYDVDFVGSQHLGEGIPGFDYHSEAHDARSIREIAMGSRTKDLDYPESGIYAWLERNPADFVLLHVGSDGVRPARVTDVKTLLDEIDRWERDNKAEVRVLLARIIDRKPVDPGIVAFNDGLQALAEDRINNPANPAFPDQLTIVDQHAALAYPTDLKDTRHPTALGYEKMANTWFKAIRTQCKPPGSPK